MKRQLVLTALFGLLLASCDGFLGSSLGGSSSEPVLESSAGSLLSESGSGSSSSEAAEPVIATCRITFGTVSDNTVSTIVGPDSYLQSGESIVASLSGTNAEKIAVMRRELAACETGIKGLDEVEFVLASLEKSGTANKVSLDLSLARGLNYYTGCIFEVKALDVEIGSITGGGRYDNLTGIFGMPGLSGVGISFGADRIYDVLNALDLYPKETRTATQLLFVNFGEAEAARCMELAAMARRAGIRTEVYPDAVKMKKQMSYASSRNIPFVALIGDEELAGGTVTLKNMETREQATLSPDDMIKAVNSPA